MGTRGKIVDVIPQVPKSSHWPPPRAVITRNFINDVGSEVRRRCGLRFGE